jgi:hypothetical protein
MSFLITYRWLSPVQHVSVSSAAMEWLSSAIELCNRTKLRPDAANAPFELWHSTFCKP